MNIHCCTKFMKKVMFYCTEHCWLFMHINWICKFIPHIQHEKYVQNIVVIAETLLFLVDDLYGKQLFLTYSLFQLLFLIMDHFNHIWFSNILIKKLLSFLHIYDISCKCWLHTAYCVPKLTWSKENNHSKIIFIQHTLSDTHS